MGWYRLHAVSNQNSQQLSASSETRSACQIPRLLEAQRHGKRARVKLPPGADTITGAYCRKMAMRLSVGWGGCYEMQQASGAERPPNFHSESCPIVNTISGVNYLSRPCVSPLCCSQTLSAPARASQPSRIGRLVMALCTLRIRGRKLPVQSCGFRPRRWAHGLVWRAGVAPSRAEKIKLCRAALHTRARR